MDKTPLLFTPHLPETRGETIALDGYEIIIADDTIELQFQLTSLQETNTSYSYYFHVIEQNSGNKVAQIDSVPLGWNYPTSIWAMGEYVRDSVRFDRTDWPDGEYYFEMGWYSEDGELRLVSAENTLTTNKSIQIPINPEFTSND